MSGSSVTGITTTLDHVAVAVPDIPTAERRWLGQLGARIVRSTPNDWPFRATTYTFPGGGRLEGLAAPPCTGPDQFVRGFLARFGSSVHHVTLKVPDLDAAMARLRDTGYDVVDYREHSAVWHEAFLRPSQTGGIVVQLGWEPYQDADSHERGDVLDPPPWPPHAATLLGPRLQHPDLERAAAIWSHLGATVEREADHLTCIWPDSPLTVVVTRGEPAGPVALRFTGTSPLPPDDLLGPAVEVPT